MGMPKALWLTKSGNKPIVNIAPSERSLNSLRQEGEISCSECALASPVVGFQKNVENQPRNFMSRVSSGKL